MPAGISTARYVCFVAASMLSTFLGAQAVHYYYNPMSDFDNYLQQELKRLPEDLKEEIISRF